MALRTEFAGMREKAGLSVAEAALIGPTNYVFITGALR